MLVGGRSPSPAVRALLPAGALVVCADSGLDHAFELGLAPDLVVGDLDSASPAALDRARSSGVPVQEHPGDKDLTDTELALRAALAAGARRVVLVGGGGTDRLDHTLGALAALADPELAAATHVEAWWGDAHVHSLHGPASATIAVSVGATVSLLPVGGPATGITTTGLRWPLDGAALSPTSSRGISNEATGPTVTVHVERGVLFVIRPDALAALRPGPTEEQ